MNSNNAKYATVNELKKPPNCFMNDVSFHSTCERNSQSKNRRPVLCSSSSLTENVGVGLSFCFAVAE